MAAMNDVPASPDVVVVGGGVIGLSIAWRAAETGRRVAVVDPAPGRGATWAAAGMLAPVTEAHYGEEALAGLTVHAAEQWPAYSSDLEAVSECDTGYLRCGTIVVGADRSDRLALDEIRAYQTSLGLEVTALSGRESRELEPALSPGSHGGAHVPGDHQVDNRLLVAALLAACRAHHVTFVADRVVAVDQDQTGAVSGIIHGSGIALRAPAVVLASGWDVALAKGLSPDTLPPVRPVKGMTLRLQARALAPRLSRTVRGLVHGIPCYLVPRTDGALVVGATSEERGTDRTVDAGAVYALLRDARSLVPGIDEYELVECATGLRPATPDNAPVVGWSSVPGLALAVGHYRNGILLAPVTATAVADLIAGRPLPEVMTPFGPERFPDRVRAVPAPSAAAR